MPRKSKGQGSNSESIGPVVRMYSFITQGMPHVRQRDAQVQRICKVPIEFPAEDNREKINVDDKLLLDKYKIEKDFEGSIVLTENPEIDPPKGTVGGRDKKKNICLR